MSDRKRKDKQIVFRVDSSSDLGAGHLMRCLTLAETLRKRGKARITFMSRPLEGNGLAFVQSKGFQVAQLNSKEENYLSSSARKASDILLSRNILERFGKPADLLVVDHYDIDAEWETKMRSWVKRIMVIDDLANRRHDCDIILDQNICPSMMDRYKLLVPPECVCLLGSEYTLLRPQFKKIRTSGLRHRDGCIRRILVAFGGADPTNETEKTLKALSPREWPTLLVDVVVGQSNRHKERIQALCKRDRRFHYHCQVENMAALMNRADLAVGGGGVMSYERCSMGLPCLAIILSKNQEAVIKMLQTEGALRNLGWRRRVTEQTIKDGLKKLRNHPKSLLEMSQRARQFISFSRMFGADRVAKMIFSDLSRVR
jgi:UDP-2,4-diacetamido-2,4,6-trideoxy-beta-L-altropyranose hydrolase